MHISWSNSFHKTLATISKPDGHSYENEREMLFKVLYELRGNINNLQHDVNSLRKQIDERRELEDTAAYRRQHESASLEATRTTSISEPRFLPNSYQQTGAEEAEAEEINEPETLNLNDLGRQMVEKALERNGGNRKKAAQELGISDRTLYRRIKQYGLDGK